MFSIGLTGGIGSGKSTVANLFKKLGVTIVDADDIAHRITKPNTYSYETIVEHFGKSILNPDKTLNRKAIRDIIFKKPKERIWLENLLHPVIREVMKEQMIKADSVYSLLVIPLLSETNAKNFDYLNRVCVIEVAEALQIRRVMKRDDASETDVKAILASQSSNETRLKMADDVIYNNDDLEYLKSQVFELNQKYLALAKEQ